LPVVPRSGPNSRGACQSKKREEMSLRSGRCLSEGTRRCGKGMDALKGNIADVRTSSASTLRQATKLTWRQFDDIDANGRYRSDMAAAIRKICEEDTDSSLKERRSLHGKAV